MIAKKEVFLPSQRNTGFGMQVGPTRERNRNEKRNAKQRSSIYLLSFFNSIN
jgi:hypothetical protein